MKSQKAKGTVISGIPNVLPGFQRWHFQLITKASEISNVMIPSEGIFARPCPTRPRHGFVDSRLIKSTKELINLLAEAKTEDPDAEIMVGKVIDANCSAILTGDGTLTLGPGNDGATSGKKSVVYPICPIANMPSINSMAGVEINPYFELVHELTERHHPYVVQMRDGPLLPQGSTDFIPEEMKVLHVVEPHHDLLRWEQECRMFAKGTVVYGEGHGLSSHAAVHCILNNVPFIVSKKPKIGEIICASTARPSRIKDDQVWLGITWATTKDDNDSIVEFHKHKLQLALGIVHNWARLQYCKLADKLLGAAVGAIYHAGSAAVTGELRHAVKTGYEEREDVYRTVNVYAPRFLSNLSKAGATFNGLAFSDGYGGPLWANAAALLSQLGGAIAASQWKDAMMLANKIINASHNGGYLLNKFVDDTVFDKAASEPGVFFAKNMSTLYRLQTDKELPVQKIQAGKVDTVTYAGIAAANILGLDDSWKQKLPDQTSLFVMMLRGCQKTPEGWISFKIVGRTLRYDDKENGTIWEIV